MPVAAPASCWPAAVPTANAANVAPWYPASVVSHGSRPNSSQSQRPSGRCVSHNRASAFWNIGFDAGTALGSVAVGVIAELTSFATAFLVCGAIAAATLPLALHRPAYSPRP